MPNRSDPNRSDPRPRQRLRLVLDEHERERIDLAHELHEQIAQTLAVVLLDLDGVRLDRSEDAASRIAIARGHVADTIEHCRALAVALRPPMLDQLGLMLALERLAERAGVDRVHVDPTLDGAALGPALQTEVYRSIDEALARATGRLSLAVTVDRAGPDLRISLHWLDGAAPVSELDGLEARLELIGGTVSAAGGELLMHIPLERGAEDLIAVFPQSRHVETPDGERHALP
jgi:glucose-6-phosphate-specific signal transduction histidine kinase